MREREQHEKFLTLCRKEKLRDIVLGGQLWVMKQFNTYRLATGVDTWEDYLAQPEVNISKHRASKLIAIYCYFAEGLRYTPDELQDVPTYALDTIRKRNITDRELIDRLLDDSRSLSKRDFAEKFHDDAVATERTYTYLLMKKCVETGALVKVHDVPLSELFEIAKKYDTN
jgi:hypothetical protein